jgi:peroxiredoxin
MRTHMWLVACASLGASLLLGRQSFAGVEGDVDLLRQVAQGHRANRESIRTWRGTATITSESQYRGGGGPPGIEGHKSRDEVAFVYDAGAGATRWSCQRLSGTLTQDGREIEEDGTRRWFSNGLVKDGASFELSAARWDVQGNLVRRSLTIEEYRGSYLDPMYYLSERGQDIHDRMMFYVENANNEKMIPATVSRTGNMVVLQVGSGSSINRFQFDLSQGCNLVNFLAADSVVTENRTFEYEKIAGVFLPTRVADGYTGKWGDGSERISRSEVTFVNQAVNEPVNPSEFDLAALGIQPGDWVRDSRTNTGYAYGIQGAGELSGVVVDLDGLPVGECQVSVERAEDRLRLGETTSGPDGTFHFGNLPDGTLMVEAFVLPTRPGVIMSIARRAVPAGTKDVRLALPMQQKAEAVKLVPVGGQAPELVLETSPGGPACSLATFKGKPVVLAFVSIYSRPCVKVLEALKALQAEKGADKLGVIAVHDRTAKPEEIEQFRRERSLAFPIVRVPDAPRDGWDCETFRAYGVTALPTVVRIDAEGKVESVGANLP